ncbi:MAG: hypothetical protein F6K32_25345, partial [Desertifilum sp. SIO1I2]|nr:hypothetical protein [Desertifilum sp. SIO1I2]
EREQQRRKQSHRGSPVRGGMPWTETLVVPAAVWPTRHILKRLQNRID